jgi:PilZ domain
MDASTVAAPRFSLKLPMRYRPRGDSRWRETSTLNVSSSGAVFTAPEMLKPGSQVQIEIFMGAATRNGSSILAESEVLRQNSDNGSLTTVVRHLRYTIKPEAHATSASLAT